MSKSDESWMAQRPKHIREDVWRFIGDRPNPGSGIPDIAYLVQEAIDAERKRFENVLERGRRIATDKVRHAQNDEIMFEAKRADATQRRNAYSDSIDVFDVALNALKSGK